MRNVTFKVDNSIYNEFLKKITDEYPKEKVMITKGKTTNKRMFGYDKVDSKKDGDKECLFIPNEDEQKIIKDIIRLHDENGYTWQKVSNYIQKKYCKKLHPHLIRKIFLREFLSKEDIASIERGKNSKVSYTLEEAKRMLGV